jgi:hypothetical protein
MKKIKEIGNVFCAMIDETHKRYLQYIVSDMFQLNSDVIRVFKKIMAYDLSEIVNDEIDFYAQFNQKSTIIEVKASGRSNIYKNGYYDGYNTISIKSENLHYLKLHKVK